MNFIGVVPSLAQWLTRISGPCEAGEREFESRTEPVFYACKW